MRSLPGFLAIASLVSLALGSVAAALPLDVSHAGPSASRPTDGTRTLYVNLSGAATLGKNSSTMFQVAIHVSGPVTLTTNNGGGNGKGFDGSDLATRVQVTYTDGSGNVHTVQDVNVTTKIHATFAAYLGQGVDGFRYNLEMTGAEAPVLHVGLHGNATRADANDSYATLGDGNANFKTSDGADNYVLATTGTADLR
jgi:hypothetical protein